MDKEKVTVMDTMLNPYKTMELRQRSYFERLKILPAIFIMHYKFFRKNNYIHTSLYCAFMLSKLLLKNYKSVKKQKPVLCDGGMNG